MFFNNIIKLLILYILAWISHGQSSSPNWISDIHIVFMNHLDVGYNVSPGPGFAVNVLNKYFDVYFKKAIEVGAEATLLNVTFIYTTHTWLVSYYLNCPLGMGLHCPTEDDKKFFLDGVKKGYIRWHAFPFNCQLDMYDASMFEFGLQLAKDLSVNYSAPISITLSQRDVPGMTRAIIPSLRRNNVSAISVGVNSGSAPPVVPKIFIWENNADNSTKSNKKASNFMDNNNQILAMWHPGGYGGIGVNDCIYLNNFTHALAVYFRGDNQGPPNISEVLSVYSTLAQEFPSAKRLYASTFDNFVELVINDSDVMNNLSIVSGYEIGDTWSYGVQTDPWKTANHKNIQSLRAQCIRNKECIVDASKDYDFYNFSRFLLKNGEHTWGGDIKNFLNAYVNGSAYYQWTNQQLQNYLVSNNSNNDMTTFMKTWYEQRDWGLTYAIEALSNSNNANNVKLLDEIKNQMNIISNPVIPNILNQNEWTRLTNLNEVFTIVNKNYLQQKFIIQFDNRTGGLIQFNYNDINIADAKHIFGKFIYQSFTEDNFTDFISQYSYIPNSTWVPYDFGKHGLNQQFPNIVYNYYENHVSNIYQNQKDSNIFVVESIFGNNEQEYNNLLTNYGTPQYIYTQYNFSASDASFDLYVILANKTATRVPETLWLTFQPQDCYNWNVEKYSQMINMDKVVNNGSFHLHGTTGNITCQINNNEDGSLLISIHPTDSVLASFVPSTMHQFTSFPTPFQYLNETLGVGCALVDNMWGTNYPVWYPYDSNDANIGYRFKFFVQE